MASLGDHDQGLWEAFMITCRKMTAADVADAFEMLQRVSQ